MRNATGIAVLDAPVTADQKAEYVRAMFDGIAGRYDLLNSVLSAGVHRAWRRFATRCAGLSNGDSALDVCSGTGEWTTYLRAAVGSRGSVVALDFSRPMLLAGEKRLAASDSEPVQADAVHLPFAPEVFDAVTIAFGIRNVGDIPGAFREMARVLKPGGRVVCLEFAEPHPGMIRALYGWYSRNVLPAIGGIVSGRREAYAYLPASVERFLDRPRLASAMSQAGLCDVRWVDLTFGLVSVHVGVKPAAPPNRS